MAGTYAETLKIERPVTILGPNAGVKGYAARAEEAKFEGTISINSQGVTIDGLAFTGHEAKITESVNGTDRAATVIMQSADDFKFVNNYVTSGKGIVFEVNTAVNFEMSNNFFDWTKENGATGAWAWRPIRIDGKVTNFVFANNKVIQTADDDTSAGLYDIVYIQNAAGTVDIVNNNLVGYSYNWNFNIANAKEVTELNFNYNYVDGVVTVSEDEISSAILALIEQQKMIAEGAGAAPVAAVMFDKIPDIKGKKVVCVISGGNIDVTILSRVIERGLLTSGRSCNLCVELFDKPGQLQKVSQIIADCGGNVTGVYHERASETRDINGCYLRLVLETRNADHIKQITDALHANGFNIVE